MKTRFGLLFAAALLAALAHRVAAQGTVMTWTVDGQKREAIVFAPAPTTASIEHPLVFGFHGHGGNMNGASQLMHIQSLWPEAIVVYPQGLNTPSPVDPQGNKPGWQVELNQAGNVGNRDLDFFDAMVTTMHQKFSINDKRIYSTGFSNGGIFSYLLWAERSKTIAAIGEVAGRLWDSEHLTQPRALLAIAGHADTVDPFAQQQQSIETARQVDSATGPGQPCGPNCTLYASTTQTPVKTIIHPGGHVYPPWAPAEIVAFFKVHHL
jgi:polyhydroxybutyrate depolymerase